MQADATLAAGSFKRAEPDRVAVGLAESFGMAPQRVSLMDRDEALTVCAMSSQSHALAPSPPSPSRLPDIR
jgi:hypothetical protein